MTFADKNDAEKVVATFNNQKVRHQSGTFFASLLTRTLKADGRILDIRMKPAAVVQTSTPFNPPTGPRDATSLQRTTQSSFNNMRELADRERRENRRAEPQIQDGRYGFGDELERRQDDKPHNPHYGNRQEDYGQRDSRDSYNGSWRTRNRYGSANGSRGTIRHENEETGLYSDQMITDEPIDGSRNGGKGHRYSS
jgi:hypothetical protein